MAGKAGLIVLAVAAFTLGACAQGQLPVARDGYCSPDDWYRSQRPYCDPAMPLEEAERQQAIEETLQNARESLEDARKANAPDSAGARARLSGG